MLTGNVSSAHVSAYTDTIIVAPAADDCRP